MSHAPITSRYFDGRVRSIVVYEPGATSQQRVALLDCGHRMSIATKRNMGPARDSVRVVCMECPQWDPSKLNEALR